jgi:hypothetical protein
MRNLYRYVVKSVAINLETYLERYFCHTPLLSQLCGEGSLLASKMFGFLKSGDTSIGVNHILKSLMNVFHDTRCGGVGIVSAWIQCGSCK